MVKFFCDVIDQNQLFGSCAESDLQAIRNDHIRNGTEFWGKFKKRAVGRSNLRNTSTNLRNAQC